MKHVTRSIEQGWSPQCEGVPVETENVWGVLNVGCEHGGVSNCAENKVLPSELEPIPAMGFSAGDRRISRANTRELELLQERRTSLISVAVTGQIDLRALAETEAA